MRYKYSALKYYLSLRYPYNKLIKLSTIIQELIYRVLIMYL